MRCLFEMNLNCIPWYPGILCPYIVIWNVLVCGLLGHFIIHEWFYILCYPSIMYGNDRKARSIILSISRMFENVSVLSWENVFDWVFKLLFFCFMPFPVWLCFVMYCFYVIYLRKVWWADFRLIYSTIYHFADINFRPEIYHSGKCYFSPQTFEKNYLVRTTRRDGFCCQESIFMHSSWRPDWEEGIAHSTISLNLVS